jgi:hypothetical protein
MLPGYSIEQWYNYKFSPETAPLEVQLYFTGARMPMMKAELIKHEVALRNGVTVKDIMGRTRVRKITKARKEAMYEVFKETEYSLPTIGKVFGGRDHTTVISNILRHCRDNNLEIPRGANWKGRSQ